MAASFASHANANMIARGGSENDEKQTPVPIVGRVENRNPLAPASNARSAIDRSCWPLERGAYVNVTRCMRKACSLACPNLPAPNF